MSIEDRINVEVDAILSNDVAFAKAMKKISDKFAEERK